MDSNHIISLRIISLMSLNLDITNCNLDIILVIDQILLVILIVKEVRFPRFVAPRFASHRRPTQRNRGSRSCVIC
eukprot:UN24068